MKTKKVLTVIILIVGIGLLAYKGTELGLLMQGKTDGLILSPITIPILLFGGSFTAIGALLLIRDFLSKKTKRKK